MPLRVEDIMTFPVVGIEPGATIADAARLMLGNRISGLPVIDRSKRLVGIVTEGDFLRRSELGTERRRSRWLEFFTNPDTKAEEYAHACGRKVEEVMSTDVVTIAADATLDELVALMASHGIKRVPVLKEGKLVGVVARADLMRALLQTLPGTCAPSGDDGQIRREVMTQLAGQTWARTIRADVHAGVVELSGMIFDEHARDAARVLAENVPGVQSVVDRLAWVEPISGAYIVQTPATEV